ncbi:MAG: ligase-associated DNA damage response endonuclease PdeM [Leptolyngbyaceae cyanobacterium bins.349]|nr:ligase-associated DNA damage response endonuclease PdeM [Leptolyngbyaceae cyanobacterium bins.349]
MHSLTILGNQLHLLPEKAIYIQSLNTLLLSDVHLGKSETFQSWGVPIPNCVNQTTLDRLQKLCSHYDLEYVFILGDLFHSKQALADAVLDAWFEFVKNSSASVQLIVGNHDRALVPKLEQLSISCILHEMRLENLILSHEPTPKPDCLNICGHIHPCVRIKTRLDDLRLPCFYLEHSQNLLVLPSFGEFTGGYEVPLNSGTTAYAVAENTIIPLNGKR